MSHDAVLIVGGGLAGLACATRLERAGVPWELHEASLRVGGRVGGQRVDGFTIDRGFQVLLDSYDELGRVLDVDRLDLQPFEPGAIVRRDGRFVRVADPLRRPGLALGTLASGIFGPLDALALLRLRFGRPAPTGLSTRERLRRAGVGDRALESFFEPFLGGVFLERELETPAAMFDFVFGHFARGSATLPREGMQMIPDLIASALPPERLHLGSPVARVDAERVADLGAERRPHRAVVHAVDEPAAARLTGRPEPERAWRGTVQLSFAAERSPVDGAWLVLNGEPGGVINNLCVPSEVCADYAPAGRSLVSVSVLGDADDDATLERSVREELTTWYGPVVDDWTTVEITHVPHSLPTRFARATGSAGATRVGDGLYRCGDWLEEPSIDGALRSGRAAAEAILEREAGSG